MKTIKKIIKWSVISVLGLIALGVVIGIATDSEETPATETKTEVQSEAKKEEPKKEVAEPVEEEEPKEEVKEPVKKELVKEELKKEESKKEEPKMSVSQQNAIKHAKQYIEYTPFSKTGLIEQLEYEGYSKEDATFAVNTIEVDWKEQAVIHAQQYLDYTPFSKQGLIDQLMYEGHNQSDATHAATQVGL